MAYKVHFLPENKEILLEESKKLLDICQEANVLIDGSCAGKGSCGKCKVQILEGNVGELTEAEKENLTQIEKKEGYRLACQMVVESDLTVMMPDLHGSSGRKKRMNRLPEGFFPSKALEKTYIKMKKSSLENPVSDIEILKKELGKEKLKASRKALIDLQKAIAAKRRKITAVTLGDELVTVEPMDTTDCAYGIAFDVGTTTIVGILWNLINGEMVDVEAATNPQSVYGSDVISRIQYCIEQEKEEKEGAGIMQEKLITCLNRMTDQLCNRAGISSDAIYDISLVGNTTMTHLFLGIHPASLAKVPFAPVYSGGISFMASEVKLKGHPMARVYVLPNIAGHVGADITAVMLATDLFHRKGSTIVLDIGTNGEILVACDGQILACSTAAGPAFEGACISCGMRAARGAIEKVRITDDVFVKTIEDAKAMGICGSGLIDVTAQMLERGLIETNGNMITKAQALEKGMGQALSERLYGEGKDKGFVLVFKENGDHIVITQKDVREVHFFFKR